MRRGKTLGGEQSWPSGGGTVLDSAASERRSVSKFLKVGFALAGGLAASLCPASAHGEMVLGYYAGWEYWQMSPDQIDWQGINCVAHFAADPRGDGTLDLDRFQLFPSRIEQMVRLARDNEACVLLTIGGANTKWAFADATASATVRARFVENIVNAVVEYGYDGVDIDWEPLQDSDEAQFTALIRELRAALDARAPGAMLTVAVGYEWGTYEAKNTTEIIASVIDDLDYINLMTYALAGPWGGWVTWHNSALHGETFPGSTKPLPTAEVVVEQYDAVGVPRAKMILGLAFFGRIWQGGAGTPTGGVTAPRQSWTTAPSMSGEYQYYKIVARSDFQRNDHWDDVAKTPYLGIDHPSSADDLFIPYENPRSIKEKVRYAATQRLGGLMIWKLRSDLLENGQRPLIQALKDEYQAQYGALPGDVPLGTPSDPGPAPDPEPTPKPTPRLDTIHVSDLDNTLTVNSGQKWQAAVQVRIHDGAEQPVAGVGVKGRWSIDANAWCQTDGSGQCSFPTKTIRKEASVTFAIIGVARTSFSYVPEDNHDHDGDSDGTSITIARPQP